jgi:hypothetical protein
LNDASEGRDVPDGRNDAITHATFEAQWITNHDHALAFLWRRAIERQRTDVTRRRIDPKQCYIAFSIYGNDPFNLIYRAGERMNLGPVCVFDDVPVGNDAVRSNEEAAPA